MRIFLILILFINCTPSAPPNYSKEEFLTMAKAGDPNLRIITPKSISESLVNCSDYTPRCRYGYRVVIRNVEMVVLYFEKQKDALNAAKRVKGYVSRNWVLDEVKDEPVLERFVVKYLKAEKAF